MQRNTSPSKTGKPLEAKNPSLPNVMAGLEATLSRGKTLPTEGTNVIRVPFGIRRAQRERPSQPQRLATLILPFQREGNPTPPPHAA